MFSKLKSRKQSRRERATTPGWFRLPTRRSGTGGPPVSSSPPPFFADSAPTPAAGREPRLSGSTSRGLQFVPTLHYSPGLEAGGGEGGDSRRLSCPFLSGSFAPGTSSPPPPPHCTPLCSIPRLSLVSVRSGISQVPRAASQQLVAQST